MSLIDPLNCRSPELAQSARFILFGPGPTKLVRRPRCGEGLITESRPQRWMLTGDQPPLSVNWTNIRLFAGSNAIAPEAVPKIASVGVALAAIRCGHARGWRGHTGTAGIGLVWHSEAQVAAWPSRYWPLTTDRIAGADIDGCDGKRCRPAGAGNVQRCRRPRGGRARSPRDRAQASSRPKSAMC